MRTPIVTPDLGPAVISLWLVAPGEPVFAGDRVVELLVGDATFDVAAPVSGRLAEKLASVQAAVHAGQILGFIEPDE